MVVKAKIDRLLAAVRQLAPRPTAQPRATLFLPDDGSACDLRPSIAPGRTRIFLPNRAANLIACGATEGDARKQASTAYEAGGPDDAEGPPPGIEDENDDEPPIN